MLQVFNEIPTSKDNHDRFKQVLPETWPLGRTNKARYEGEPQAIIRYNILISWE